MLRCNDHNKTTFWKVLFKAFPILNMDSAYQNNHEPSNQDRRILFSNEVIVITTNKLNSRDASVVLCLPNDRLYIRITINEGFCRQFIFPINHRGIEDGA